jgi:hypothetical protein
VVRGGGNDPVTATSCPDHTATPAPQQEGSSAVNCSGLNENAFLYFCKKVAQEVGLFVKFSFEIFLLKKVHIEHSIICTDFRLAVINFANNSRYHKSSCFCKKFSLWQNFLKSHKCSLFWYLFA